MHQWSASGSGTGESLECFGRNQCYPVGTGKGIWWYWATSGSGTGKSVSITMVATVGVYTCSQCKAELFYSTKKFEHSSSWPVFTETVQPDSVSKRPDGHNAYKVGVTPPT